MKAAIVADGESPENYKLYVTRRGTRPEVIKKKRHKEAQVGLRQEVAQGNLRQEMTQGNPQQEVGKNRTVADQQIDN